MSLYHEAAEILEKACKDGGSLKSIVFGRKDWKNDSKTLFALTVETAKWSEALSEVVERSGVLKNEKQITPTLALVLVHDLLLAKKGLALPPNHGLCVSVSRHRARLSAELTKARLRRRLASIEDFKTSIDEVSTPGTNSKDGNSEAHPRWVRINTLRTSLQVQMRSTFSDFQCVESLGDLIKSSAHAKVLYIDEHVPNLIAVSPQTDIANTKSHKSGEIIFQDKASCFPAYLLDPRSEDGDIIDACAAPGNKTTHIAALMKEHKSDKSKGQRHEADGSVIACEKDSHRSQTLSKMVKLAGAEQTVRIKSRQDFLQFKPQAQEFRKVTALLLDPSCSGSGIIGRDEVTVKITFPRRPDHEPVTKGKKRKREENNSKAISRPIAVASELTVATEEQPAALETNVQDLETRLTALSSFQLRILEHAMAFVAAKKITYSTCSLHDEENEHVVVRALLSSVAKTRGWKVLLRKQQITGMQKWHRRGKPESIRAALTQVEAKGDDRGTIDVSAVADACIRCEKGGHDGTMGFFVAAFVRDSSSPSQLPEDSYDSSSSHGHDQTGVSGSEVEEWSGFSDTEM